MAAGAHHPAKGFPGGTAAFGASILNHLHENWAGKPLDATV